MGITNRQKFDKVMVWVICAGMAAALGWTGVSCMNRSPDQPRPVSQAEAERLAQVRVTGAEIGIAAMRLDLPESLGGAGLDGYVDWNTPMVHATTRSDGTPTGLVQAVPGLIAAHASTDITADEEPPADGWTVRRMQPQDSPDADPGQAAIDILLSAMLALGSPTPADSAFLAENGVWLREATIDGADVDVIRAPLLLQPDANDADAGAQQPEAVFWVDGDSQLRRLQADPAGNGLATIDLMLDRPDPPALEPVDILGGAAVTPRDLSDDEAERLAGLRFANSGRAALIDLRLPVADDEILTAQGWVDWRSAVAYLAIDAPGDTDDGLLFALPSGVANIAADVDGLPPTEPPQEGWTVQKWDERVDSGQAGDLDTLVYKLLSMASLEADTTEDAAEAGTWLREDTVGDAKVDVVEFATAGDPETEAGAAPYRYWLDREESLLHRVQLRTNGFGMGQATLTIEEPPMLNVPYGVVTSLAG